MLPLLRDIANLLYPPRCILCSAEATESTPAFCSDCNARLTDLTLTPRCPRCAAPLPPESSCPRCAAGSIYPLQQIAALAPFRDPLRPLIHQMKYRHRWPVAELLAARLLAQPSIADMLRNTDALLPIPLHWRRHIARGYNQSESIATHLARHTGLRVIHPLKRIRHTIPQTTLLNRASRAANVRHAFELTHPATVHGKRILLIDDVMTTSATLRSAARTLLPAEPAAISAIVLAVADARRRDFQAI